MEELTFRTKAILQALPDSLSRYEYTLTSQSRRQTYSQREREKGNSWTHNQGLVGDAGQQSPPGGASGLHSLQLMEKDIEDSLHTVATNCDRLNVLVTSEVPAKRDLARVTIDQMQYDCKRLRATLNCLQQKRHRYEEDERNRSHLLASEFTTNRDAAAALASSSGGGKAAVIQMGNGGGGAEAAELRQHSRLSTVARRLDEMLAGGGASLAGLKEQRLTLKSAHKRILDVTSTLGLSNTVMRLIERRTHQDKIIFWLLVAGTCLFMWAVWRFFRG